MKLLLITLLSGIFTAPVLARDTNCLYGFANVAGESDVDPYTVVSQYYNELLNSLGGGHLKPETIRAIIESKDPFAIPDQPGADLFNLQRKMREFEELVKAREWNTPEIRAQLIEDLAGRAGEVERAKEKIETMVKKIEEFDVPIENGGMSVSSPDGRYVIHRKNHGKPIVIEIYDLETKTGKELTLPFEYDYRMFFSPDGKELMFPQRNQYYKAAPFNDGNLDLAGVHDVGTRSKINIPGSSYQASGANPNHVYFSVNDRATTDIDRIDRSTGQRTALKLSAYLGKNGAKEHKARRWQLVPGTDTLSLLWQDTVNGKVYLDKVKVAQDGKLTRTDRRETFNSGLENVVYSYDGKYAFAWGKKDGGVYYYPAKAGAEPKELKVHNVDDADLLQVAAHPTEPKIAIVYQNPDGRRWAEILSADKRQVIGRVTLPSDTESIQFSPNGKKLFAVQDKTMRVLEIENRF